MVVVVVQVDRVRFSPVQVPAEVKRECWIPCSWSLRCLWAVWLGYGGKNSNCFPLEQRFFNLWVMVTSRTVCHMSCVSDICITIHTVAKLQLQSSNKITLWMGWALLGCMQRPGLDCEIEITPRKRFIREGNTETVREIHKGRTDGGWEEFPL